MGGESRAREIESMREEEVGRELREGDRERVRG
jgi:hypothetical protein